jgi:hypothetical protein
MKRLIQKVIILTVFSLLLTSCAVIRRGCGCTAQTQKTIKQVPTQTTQEAVVVLNIR